ncbi:glycosyltransferase family 2 protein [Cellulophaga baltica]|uniref:glycosyltransferase family 2 protein n=1 Tax=Cellulophaga TaxID=104264 RepID=UPI001C079EE8|nr:MULTISPECIES: glycosyltransferase family 2 protein [Cellulophaga]MBU2997861.1 glycosyltransferase family 2 protein [Cellulophaga baltica]MDO6769262.1 glycosyltransferase family 2 protein [Cellulophaga sp. 1_MG-2023]
MKEKLSVFITTFNEERILDICLKQLLWVDEIVVVDSGSTDATEKICKKYGVKFLHKDLIGFSEQKQFAIDNTTNEWVLNLDADEILSKRSIEEIKEVIKKDSSINGYYLKRKLVFLGKVFNYGPESKQYLLRLFKKSHAKYNGKMVNEDVIINGETAKLNGDFLHFTARSLESYLAKLTKYAVVCAENNYLKNVKFSMFQIFIKVNFEFVKKYFFELNFLNGKEGFYWSLITAYYSGLKRIKTNEHYKEVKKKLLF